MLEILVADLVPTCEIVRYAGARRHTPAPCGVVAVVGSGRTPLLEVIAASVPALVEGNAVAIKLSAHTCWSGLTFIDLLRDVLREHRCSAELVQPITGHDDTTEALLALADDTVDANGSPSPTAPLLAAIDSGDETYARIEATLRLAYAHGLRRRARAVLDLLAPR
jgi:acyl-CoA reductase-like NAD-dependent aldehyde dehydrogenase